MVLKLEEAEAQSREHRARLSLEKDELKRQLQSRLRDLEPLPEKLKQTEHRLKEAQHSAQVYEQRNSEHTATLAQLRLKARNIQL